MSTPTHRSPARLLAPLALLVAILALMLVLGSSLGSSDGGEGSDTQAAPARQTSRGAGSSETETDQESSARAQSRSATYTVKAGDTPGAIADELGLTLDRLLELNPELDPNALVAGQKLKLR